MGTFTTIFLGLSSKNFPILRALCVDSIFCKAALACPPITIPTIMVVSATINERDSGKCVSVALPLEHVLYPGFHPAFGQDKSFRGVFQVLKDVCGIILALYRLLNTLAKSLFDGM